MNAFLRAMRDMLEETNSFVTRLHGVWSRTPTDYRDYMRGRDTIFRIRELNEGVANLLVCENAEEATHRLLLLTENLNDDCTDARCILAECVRRASPPLSTGDITRMFFSFYESGDLRCALAVADMHMSRNATPNTGLSAGSTLLHNVAYTSQRLWGERAIAFVTELVNAGWDPTARTAQGCTPADMARRMGRDDVAFALERMAADLQARVAAVRGSLLASSDDFPEAVADLCTEFILPSQPKRR